MSDFEKYLEKINAVHGLISALGLLNWDQETMMPSKAVLCRSRCNAVLSGLVHEIMTSPDFGELLERLSDQELSFDQTVAVRETKRDRDRAVKVPRKLVEELAMATTAANQTWVQARRENNWSLFAPDLQKIVELRKQQAEAIGYDEEPYDALLTEYEPGESTSNLVEQFSSLRDKLVPLLDKIRAKGSVDYDKLLQGNFEPALQQTMCIDLLECIGFDFSGGRLDSSAHPFTAEIGCNTDVRLTVAYHRDNLGAALYAAIHEGGHGIYEQGLPSELMGTPLSESVSLGIHESQSRLWENMVGRSKPFSVHLHKELSGLFPAEFKNASADDLYRAVNVVKQSPIRIEADEVTYNLHIILRMELERALIQGDIDVADLPDQWNESMRKYLGITPADNSQGVLQDIHWSAGAFGYFPTYTLGNLYAAQFMSAAERALPELNSQIERGELLPLLHWMRENIHQHGRRYSAGELCERATGSPLAIDPFVNYLESKYTELYSL